MKNIRKIKENIQFENSGILFIKFGISYSLLKKILDFNNFEFLKVLQLRTEKERAEYAFEILVYPDKN